jgi:rhodanese-related sulfurtransferase
MRLLNYFKPISTMAADEVRDFLNTKEPEEYNLVDVRQASEYERGHIPGARLIPIAELSSRFNELDPEKPTIAY